MEYVEELLEITDDGTRDNAKILEYCLGMHIRMSSLSRWFRVRCIVCAELRSPSGKKQTKKRGRRVLGEIPTGGSVFSVILE